MSNNKEIAREEAVQQVRQMGRMLAALYYHFSREIIKELGEEKGRCLIEKAVWNYGTERGLAQKERVLAEGHPYHPWSYVNTPDLPGLGWEVEKVADGENPTHIKITYCPFAEYWKEKGFEDIGRIYCSVDQAKYQGFHPDSDYVHLQNVLSGDSCCEMICLLKKESGDKEDED